MLDHLLNAVADRLELNDMHPLLDDVEHSLPSLPNIVSLFN